MKLAPIVAIGGGSIGTTSAATTTSIDREAIRLTGKKHPNVLFVPTASRDRAEYIDRFTAHYGGTLGCKVKVLRLYGSPWRGRRGDLRHGSSISDSCQSRIRVKDDSHSAKALIDWAELIYVGGGNPLRMLKRWRALGIDELLNQAHHDGKVLAGMSAGAMCWFQYGLTDCWRRDHDPSQAIACRGLNLIPGLCNPHYHSEPWRISRQREVLQKNPTSEVGFGIDDNAAIVIEGDRFRVVTSDSSANVFLARWEAGHYVEESLPTVGPLALLSKKR